MHGLIANASNRLTQVQVGDDAEASKVSYLHNAAGQRVFKSEPQVAQTAPSEEQLGADFITWLKKNFGWLFAQAQQNATLGQSFVYGDDPIGSYNLLGEYGNGGSKSAGRMEYIYLPTETGTAQLIGLYRSNRFYAVHTDHLGTPRQITDDTNKVVWQWAYSAFEDNKPTGILKATTNPKAAITNQPKPLTATSPSFAVNLRFPGQYWDEESKLSYNYFRSYQPNQGRYTQSDPIGLAGGWNTYAYANGSPLKYTDPMGLATQAEIDAAIKTLRDNYPNDFPSAPTSVSPFPMGDNGLGMTDWGNNIRLNADRFGGGSQCVKSGDEYQFLQTLAHEMLHVNEALRQRLLSNSFRMGNPLGYFRRKLDEKADEMVTQQIIEKYIKARNANKDCTCR
ncbi:Rhs repeat-associated core [Comamonadaceae bacterium]